MENNRLWHVIGALAALVFIAALVRGRGVTEVILETPSQTPTPTESLTPSVTPRVSARRRTPTPKPTPSYAEVAEQWAGRRIEFDMYCQALPLESTYTDGTEVMLDNRSGDDRVVAVNGIQHGLRGYGWKIITLTADTLPATWAVDCGTAKNVAKIIIEPIPTLTPEPLPSPRLGSGLRPSRWHLLMP